MYISRITEFVICTYHEFQFVICTYHEFSNSWYVHITNSNSWYVHITNSNSWYVHITKSNSWYVHITNSWLNSKTAPHTSVRLSVCNVGVLWPNGLSDRDDFWHTPCPGQQWPCVRRRSESPLRGELAPVKVVRAQNLRTARPVNKNYRLLNILRNANVNKVGRPTSAIAEFLL